VGANPTLQLLIRRKNMTKTEQEVEKIILPVVEGLGYELYDVEYVKEGSDMYLRLYIDKDIGIGLDDCEKVSNEVSLILDEVDPIKSQYLLEVSSCGVERRFREEKHFIQNIGKEIEITLFKAIEKEKKIIGIIDKFENDIITLTKEDNKTINIDFNNIASAKLIYKWEE
jgi:ribosome maturation factor RimP